MKRKQRIKVFGAVLILLVLNIIIPSVHSEDIREGLVSRWNFDDCAANDSVGTNHGTIVGPANFESRTVGGKEGKSIVFNGNGNYVTVPDSPSLNFTKAVTISLWINWGGQKGKYPGLVSKGYVSGEHTPGEFSYSIQIRKDVNLLWWEVGMLGKDKKRHQVTYMPDGSRVVDNSSVTQTYGVYYYPSDSEIFPNRWIHVATTFDGGELQIYVNGRKMQSSHDYQMPTPGRWDVTTAPLEIGHLPGWHYFKGKIDDVRLYNRVLSTQEIEALYQFGK